MNPNAPDILAVRGLVLFLGEKLPQALQHLVSALRLDPGHEKARRLRVRVKDIERLKEEGNTSFKLGSLSEAVNRYTEALDVCDLVCCILLVLTSIFDNPDHWRIGRERKWRSDSRYPLIKSCNDVIEGVYPLSV